MNDEQFEALAALMRMRSDSPNRAAARAVLVEGKSQAEAAREHGAFQPSLSRTMHGVRETIARAAQLLVIGGALLETVNAQTPAPIRRRPSRRAEYHRAWRAANPDRVALYRTRQ